MFLLSLALTSALIGALAPGVEAGSEAVELLQQYLRVDTTNPPGNESRAVAFFAEIFDREGIAWESVESAPGRGNVWARLEGGDEPALVLLHHSDVVPADPDYWDVDPFAGEIRDGYLYGRGALDTKGLGIVQLAAFLELHRSGAPLRRDVVYLATADEEAGGLFGVGWLIENRPDLFENVGFVLNEGGGGQQLGEQLPVFAVEVTQKVPLWLRLVARGEPGHGSTPRVETAPTRLVRALDAVRRHRFAARAVPAVAEYFAGLAATGGPRLEPLRDLEALVRDPDALLRLQLEFPRLHALLRNTCSITRFEGSSKINVVPPEVSAELDCRLLPDQDHEAFLDELRAVINDPQVAIETVMEFTPAVSPTDTELYRTIESVIDGHYPGSRVFPAVLTGFTDSHFVRDLGITAYGFGPTVVPEADGAGVHGNNERVPIAALQRGVAAMIELLREFAVEDASVPR